MKRNFFWAALLVAACMSAELSAQTTPLELEFLQKAVANKEMEQKVADFRYKRFMELTKRPDYPKLPFDTINRMYDVSFTYACPGMSKADILRKVQDWSLARYLRRGTGVQQVDTASGTVFVLGYADLRANNITQGWGFINSQQRVQFVECNLMWQIQAKDGALIGKVVNIEYMLTRIVGFDNCLSTFEELRTMGSLTPFSAQEIYRMEGLVNLFISTAEMLGNTEKDLIRFVKDK